MKRRRPLILFTQAQEILTIVRPNPPLPEEIYYAVLNSLAKALLSQAEVEVTAEKRTATNLAHLAVALLTSLDFFPDIFFAKLVQRTGGWAIPCIVPARDVDGSDLDQDQAKRRKAMGYAGEEETGAEYAARVAGIMRVYFEIVVRPHPKPLPPIFGTSRYWSYFARMIKEPRMLMSSVAPELLYGTSPFRFVCHMSIADGR